MGVVERIISGKTFWTESKEESVLQPNVVGLNSGLAPTGEQGLAIGKMGSLELSLNVDLVKKQE